MGYLLAPHSAGIPPCPRDLAYISGSRRQLRTQQLTQTSQPFLLLPWQHLGHPLPSGSPSSQDAWERGASAEIHFNGSSFHPRLCHSPSQARRGGGDIQKDKCRPPGRYHRRCWACVVVRECALFRGWVGALRRLHPEGKKDAGTAQCLRQRWASCLRRGSRKERFLR